MEETGVFLPVIDAHCEYLRSARYDDEVEIETTGEILSPVRIEFHYTVRIAGSESPRRSAPRCTRRRRPMANRAGCRNGCEECSREGTGHRRRRVHRFASGGIPRRLGRGRHRDRLLHRLLRPRGQGAQSDRAAAGRTFHVRSRRRCRPSTSTRLARRRDPRLPPGGPGRRPKELGPRLPDLHLAQRGLDPAPARSGQGPADRPLRLCLELVGVRRRGADSRCGRTPTCSRCRRTA